MSEEYYVGQILDNTEGISTYELNQKGFSVFTRTFIDSITGEKVFKYILGNILTKEDEIIFNTLDKEKGNIRQWFSRNDYKHNKYLRGDYTEEEWNIIKESFKQKTIELTNCIKEYDKLIKKYTGYEDE